MKWAETHGRTAILAASALAALAGVWLDGCTNDPFDPASVINQRPVARIFVTPPDGSELNPTSYYQRTFHWSGSDVDGFVVAYYVSIETGSGAADWDTTTVTDTTMTFTTDDEGRAEATIHVACRDDRGALSDTVSQFIPLRNFPPVINFQADYDTLRWSFGAANFRFFAIDLDGNETMADSFLYKLDTADSSIVRIFGQPDADPALCWVKNGFEDPVARTFTVPLVGVPPDPARTLTVSVMDEAAADARMTWTWEVREARGPVLLVADASPFTGAFYASFMDSTFGSEAWSRYEILVTGLPDEPWVLTETFRQFPAVLWYTGGVSSRNLKGAANALRDYVQPGQAGQPAGRLLLVDRAVTGAGSDLPFSFIQGLVGVSPTAAPVNTFTVPQDTLALGQQPWLPDIAAASNFAIGLGLNPLSGTEILYRMTNCADWPNRNDWYSLRPPYDPVVAVRRPERSTEPLASVVTMSLQLETFRHEHGRAVLRAILSEEMGVGLP